MVNLARKVMDPIRRLISATHLNATLERAGVLGDAHVQDATIISDRPTLMSRIIRLRLQRRQVMALRADRDDCLA